MTFSIFNFPFSIQQKAQELNLPVDSYLVPFNQHKGLPENKKETNK